MSEQLNNGNNEQVLDDPLDQEVKVHPGGIVAAAMKNCVDWGEMWNHLGESGILRPDELRQLGAAVTRLYPDKYAVAIDESTMQPAA